MLFSMPTFVEMDQELALKLIEGYENELEPEQKKQEAFYRNCACPRCGGQCEKRFISADHAFGDGSVLPRSGLKCTMCNCLFDPHSNLILEIGVR
jgi:hypothetical protein